MTEEKEPTQEQWDKAFGVADRILDSMSEEEIDELIARSEREQELEDNAEVNENIRDRLGAKPSDDKEGD